MVQDMTSGSPMRLLVMFTIPLLIGNVFQLLYSTVDSLVVGRFIGPGALAAVSNASVLIFLLLGFFWGLPVGLAIVTGQRFGAHEPEQVRRSVASSIVINGVFALMLTAVALVFLRPLLRLLNTPPEIFEDTADYLLVSFIGLGSMAFSCLFASQIRAVGDSRTPLYIGIACALLNAALDYWFVCRFNWGVAGVAWATVLVQLIYCGICFAVIKRRLRILLPQRKDWTFDLREYWEHLKLALPMGIQFSVIAVGAVVLQGAINSLGADYVAAVGVCTRIEAFATMPMVAVAAAVSTFTAQNCGAKHYDRVFSGVSLGIRLMVIFALGFGFPIIIFARLLTEFFVGPGHDQIVYLVHVYYMYTVPAYSVLGMLFIYRHALSGLGHTGIPLIGGMIEVLSRVFGALYLTAWFGFAGVSLTTALTWGCNALFMGLFFRHYRIKLLGVGYGRVASPPGRNARSFMSRWKNRKNTFMEE